MTGRKKYEEGLEQLMIQSIQHHLWNMVEQCDGMSMAFSGSELLVFSDGETEIFWSVQVLQGYPVCQDSIK